jgi:hypothetical protein
MEIDCVLKMGRYFEKEYFQPPFHHTLPTFPFNVSVDHRVSLSWPEGFEHAFYATTLTRVQ